MQLKDECYFREPQKNGYAFAIGLRSTANHKADHERPEKAKIDVNC